MFPNRQVFLLSFFITLIQSVDLRGDFVKTPTNFISKRLNLSLQFLLQKQPQSFHFVLVEWHARLSIMPVAFGQENKVDKRSTSLRIFFWFDGRTNNSFASKGPP